MFIVTTTRFSLLYKNVIGNSIQRLTEDVRRGYHLRFIASRRHCPNFANSSLHTSFLTSLYVAKIHRPYVDAWNAQVPVE